MTKLIEELGELIQVLSKKDAFMDTDIHPDGKGSLKRRTEEEIGDVLAAIAYSIDKIPLDADSISSRTKWVGMTDESVSEQQEALNRLLSRASRLLVVIVEVCRHSKDFVGFNGKEMAEGEIGTFCNTLNLYIKTMELDKNFIAARKNTKLNLFKSWDISDAT